MYETQLGPARVTGPLIKALAVFLAQPSNQISGAEVIAGTKLKSGTVYPMLARLSKLGWLEATWEDIDPESEGRPPRRLYHLTKGGQTRAKSLMLEHYPQPLSDYSAA